MGDNKRNSDLRLKRFGHWTVLHPAPIDGSRKNMSHNKYWICVCDCGTIALRTGSHLRQGETTSCGCSRREAVSVSTLDDLTGRRFGKWVVTHRAGTSEHRNVLWHCQCDCGNESDIFAHALRNGSSTSCGCSMVGEHNWNWKGGISFEPYCKRWTNELRERIRDKFGRRCVVCGKSEADNLGKRLCVHHIDYNKQQGCSGRRWELVPLCHSCHTKTNGNRWYWYNLFHNFWVNSYTIPQ